nr:hypothetical protein [Spirochaeta thermophila]
MDIKFIDLLIQKSYLVERILDLERFFIVDPVMVHEPEIPVEQAGDDRSSVRVFVREFSFQGIDGLPEFPIFERFEFPLHREDSIEYTIHRKPLLKEGRLVPELLHPRNQSVDHLGFQEGELDLGGVVKEGLAEEYLREVHLSHQGIRVRELREKKGSPRELSHNPLKGLPGWFIIAERLLANPLFEHELTLSFLPLRSRLIPPQSRAEYIRLTTEDTPFLCTSDMFEK